jgi:hypothetical protein
LNKTVSRKLMLLLKLFDILSMVWMKGQLNWAELWNLI